MSSGKVLVILAVLACANAVWLESPRVTNWGDWGEAVYCNASEYVYGFRLKVQQDQGILDDTALNGIELHCVKSISGNRTLLTSSVGIKGAWGTIKECAGNSYAVGFEMRTEKPVLIDNTAANNFRLYCSDNNMLEGVGMSWGEWTGALFCPANMKICGIKTQVEDPVETNPPKGGTGINNVDMWCCNVGSVAGEPIKLSKKF